MRKGNPDQDLKGFSFSNQPITWLGASLPVFALIQYAQNVGLLRLSGRQSLAPKPKPVVLMPHSLGDIVDLAIDLDAFPREVWASFKRLTNQGSQVTVAVLV